MQVVRSMTSFPGVLCLDCGLESPFAPAADLFRAPFDAPDDAFLPLYVTLVYDAPAARMRVIRGAHPAADPLPPGRRGVIGKFR